MTNLKISFFNRGHLGLHLRLYKFLIDASWASFRFQFFGTSSTKMNKNLFGRFGLLRLPTLLPDYSPGWDLLMDVSINLHLSAKIMYENLSVAELVFTKRKLKHAYLSLGQHSTILKSTLNSCNMIGRELRFFA